MLMRCHVHLDCPLKIWHRAKTKLCVVDCSTLAQSFVLHENVQNFEVDAVHSGVIVSSPLVQCLL